MGDHFNDYPVVPVKLTPPGLIREARLKALEEKVSFLMEGVATLSAACLEFKQRLGSLEFGAGSIKRP